VFRPKTIIFQNIDPIFSSKLQKSSVRFAAQTLLGRRVDVAQMITGSVRLNCACAFLRFAPGASIFSFRQAARGKRLRVTFARSRKNRKSFCSQRRKKNAHSHLLRLPDLFLILPCFCRCDKDDETADCQMNEPCLSNTSDGLISTHVGEFRAARLSAIRRGSINRVQCGFALEQITVYESAITRCRNCAGAYFDKSMTYRIAGCGVMEDEFFAADFRFFETFGNDVVFL